MRKPGQGSARYYSKGDVQGALAMPLRTYCSAIAVAASFALAGVSAAQTTGAKSGAVEQTGASAVPQDIKPPPLKLTDAQRDQIRKVLTPIHTETKPTKTSTQAERDFKPAIGATVPGGFHVDGLPQPLISEIPVLKQYGYLKFNNQILIVDGTTKKVVEQIPEG
jgi:hypothetical protein